LNLGDVAHLAACFGGFRGQVTAFIHQGRKVGLPTACLENNSDIL